MNDEFAALHFAGNEQHRWAVSGGGGGEAFAQSNLAQPLSALQNGVAVYLA
jgi:hypothetical protein